MVFVRQRDTKSISAELGQHSNVSFSIALVPGSMAEASQLVAFPAALPRLLYLPRR